jgi:archaetidylinositol phosphate synthase
MLDKLRGRLNVYFFAIGRRAATIIKSPTGWTFVGLGISFLAAAAFTSLGSHEGELLGGILVLASGFFDIIDGAVAKATGRVSKRGAFLDSTLDRVAEVAIYFGIMAGGLANPLLVLLAVSFSLLVSYTRARGEALGANLAGIGIGERSERLLVLAVASIVGYTWIGVIVVVIIAAYTFLLRTYRASASL